jgi:hypothetical protein
VLRSGFVVTIALCSLYVRVVACDGTHGSQKAAVTITDEQMRRYYDNYNRNEAPARLASSAVSVLVRGSLSAVSPRMAAPRVSFGRFRDRSGN